MAQTCAAESAVFCALSRFRAEKHRKATEMHYNSVDFGIQNKRGTGGVVVKKEMTLRQKNASDLKRAFEKFVKAQDLKRAAKKVCRK